MRPRTRASWKLFDFESEGAALIAEGKVAPSSTWTFRRWRFNAR